MTNAKAVRPTLTTTAQKLPKEGQDWIASLSEGERSATEGYLERMGEAEFIANWRALKAEADYWRDF